MLFQSQWTIIHLDFFYYFFFFVWSNQSDRSYGKAAEHDGHRAFVTHPRTLAGQPVNLTLFAPKPKSVSQSSWETGRGGEGTAMVVEWRT